MNILVTGGCGYVGTNLVHRLLDEGHIVTVVDIMWFGNFLQNHKNLIIIKEDIRNINQIFMEGINAIIHLASIANDPSSELNPKLTWEINVLAVMQLIEKAIKHRVKQFIYASSGSVYGIKSESQVTEDLSLLPISDYNKTKMIAERILLSYQDKILIQIVRPATVCGYSPRMRLDLSVNMLTMQALTKRKVTVFGGKQIRPNIYIRDMIEVYLHFLRLGKRAVGIYNAGFENISILDIAKEIVEFMPATKIVVTESNDPRSYHLSSEKLLNTGFVSRYGIINGIRDIVCAYRSGILKDEDQYYNIRTMKGILK